MKITSFLIFFTFLFSYQGEIVSIEFMDFMNVEDVQNNLDDTFGSYAPEAEYDISIYKIIYEDIKNGTKVTCKLSDIQINNINQEIIDLINTGFNVENQENE